MLSVKKELKIFRGTYEEIQAQPTEDMTIYLSWDTQEIFVGNKYGVKTPYIGGNRLTEREIRDLFTTLTNEELELLRAQVVTINVTSNNALTTANAVNTRLDDLEQDLRDDIIEEILALTAPGGALNEIIYTRAETDAVIAQVLLNYYTKAQVDAKFPELGVGTTFADDYLALKSAVESLQNADSTFDSIKILDDEVITETQLLAYAQSSEVAQGIYRFQTSDGYELLNKSASNVTRLSPDGKLYILNDGDFIEVLDQSAIRSINGITTEDGTITLDLDDIDETETKVFNSLLPQANNVVNPLGRNENFNAGAGSIAFGFNSVAQGTNSIAIGLGAVANANNSVQIGNGSNTSANTLKFLDNEIINSSGKIPNERLLERFSEAQLMIQISDWNDTNDINEAIKTLNGITENSIIWLSPANNSFTAYSRSGVRGISQSVNTIVFKCDIIPSETIIVNVVWRN